MGIFGRDTDSDKASSTENHNNAEYKRGYDSGRNTGFIGDMFQSTIGDAVASDQYTKGYEAGRNDRDKK